MTQQGSFLGKKLHKWFTLKNHTIFYLFLISNLLAAGFDHQAQLWYEDKDLDGYGNSEQSILSIEQPPGYVAVGDDCNDDPHARGFIFHPDAKEPCNYDDYNCDGYIRSCEHAPNGLPAAKQTDIYTISSFAIGHPFRVNSIGTENLNDTNDFYQNIGVKQSALITTDGQGNAKNIQALNLGPFDFSKTQPKLWLKIDQIAHATDISFFVGNKNFRNYVRFNLKSSQGQKWITEGDWVSFSISWNPSNFSAIHLQEGLTLSDFRRSITDFRLQIRDDKIAPVTLHINRLSAVMDTNEKLTNGMISITFDDGWESQYSQAKPILDSYSYKATAYTIVGFLDTPNYMQTSQLLDLEQKSHWEIAFHAFDPIMHINSYTSYPSAAIERDILSGRQWLWENGFNFGNNGRHGLAHFAYPKGNFRLQGKTDVLEIARRYFSTARSINERHRENIIAPDAHKLRVLYITAPESVESVSKAIADGIASREWIILVFHQLVTNPVTNDQWEISKFKSLIDYINSELAHVPVLTIGDAITQTLR